MLATVILIYLADSFAMWKTFGWFLAKLPFRDVLIVRGATYLLAAINYSVGQGAIVYFVHRGARGPRRAGRRHRAADHGDEPAGAVDVRDRRLAGGGTQVKALVPVVTVAWVGLGAYAVVVLLRPRFLASRPLFDVLLSAGLTGHLKAMAVRVPHIAALMAFQLVALRSLGVVLPLGVALAALPVVMFIAVLPISVQGLGTTQAAMVLFFSPYVPAGDGRSAGRRAGGQPGRPGHRAGIPDHYGFRLPAHPNGPRPGRRGQTASGDAGRLALQTPRLCRPLHRPFVLPPYLRLHFSDCD